jgi:hypothetical protein
MYIFNPTIITPTIIDVKIPSKIPSYNADPGFYLEWNAEKITDLANAPDLFRVR